MSAAELPPMDKIIHAAMVIVFGAPEADRILASRPVVVAGQVATTKNALAMIAKELEFIPGMAMSTSIKTRKIKMDYCPFGVVPRPVFVQGDIKKTSIDIANLARYLLQMRTEINVEGSGENLYKRLRIDLMLEFMFGYIQSSKTNIHLTTQELLARANRVHEQFAVFQAPLTAEQISQLNNDLDEAHLVKMALNLSVKTIIPFDRDSAEASLEFVNDTWMSQQNRRQIRNILVAQPAAAAASEVNYTQSNGGFNLNHSELASPVPQRVSDGDYSVPLSPPPPPLPNAADVAASAAAATAAASAATSSFDAYGMTLAAYGYGYGYVPNGAVVPNSPLMSGPFASEQNEDAERIEAAAAAAEQIAFLNRQQQQEEADAARLREAEAQRLHIEDLTAQLAKVQQDRERDVVQLKERIERTLSAKAKAEAKAAEAAEAAALAEARAKEAAAAAADIAERTATQIEEMNQQVIARTTSADNKLKAANAEVMKTRQDADQAAARTQAVETKLKAAKQEVAANEQAASNAIQRTRSAENKLKVANEALVQVTQKADESEQAAASAIKRTQSAAKKITEAQANADRLTEDLKRSEAEKQALVKEKERIRQNRLHQEALVKKNEIIEEWEALLCDYPYLRRYTFADLSRYYDDNRNTTVDAGKTIQDHINVHNRCGHNIDLVMIHLHGTEANYIPPSYRDLIEDDRADQLITLTDRIADEFKQMCWVALDEYRPISKVLLNFAKNRDVSPEHECLGRFHAQTKKNGSEAMRIIADHMAEVVETQINKAWQSAQDAEEKKRQAALDREEQRLRAIEEERKREQQETADVITSSIAPMIQAATAAAASSAAEVKRLQNTVVPALQASHAQVERLTQMQADSVERIEDLQQQLQEVTELEKEKERKRIDREITARHLAFRESRRKENIDYAALQKKIQEEEAAAAKKKDEEEKKAVEEAAKKKAEDEEAAKKKAEEEKKIQEDNTPAPMELEGKAARLRVSPIKCHNCGAKGHGFNGTGIAASACGCPGIYYCCAPNKRHESDCSKLDRSHVCKQ